jgi:hypothetical protein
MIQGWRHVTLCFCSSALGVRIVHLELNCPRAAIFILASSSQRLVSHAIRPSPTYSAIAVTTQDRLKCTEWHCLVEGGIL